MPTESRSPVSRRKLGIFSIVAVIAALMLVVSGIRAREDSSAKLREWTDNQAIPPVAVIYPDPGVLSATIDLPDPIPPVRPSTRIWAYDYQR